MKTNLDKIAKALREAGLPPSLSPDEIRLFIQIWRRLADGRPISPREVEQIASNLPISPDVATSVINKVSERDGEGNVVGFAGLSLKTHPHRFQVNDHTLSTWCAWDSLFLPPILKQTAQVESPCPGTKKEIGLTITPERVGKYDPTNTVISMITPKTTKKGLESAEEIWNAFCQNVHFFSSSEAASQWFSGKNLDISILSVEEGYQLGRMTFAEILNHA